MATKTSITITTITTITTVTSRGIGTPTWEIIEGVITRGDTKRETPPTLIVIISTIIISTEGTTTLIITTIATINSGILVFLESDIINYEANKKELLDADYKYWHTHIKWTFKK